MNITPGPWKAYVTALHNVTPHRQYVCVGTDTESICKLTASEGMTVDQVPDARAIALVPEMISQLREAVTRSYPGLELDEDFQGWLTKCHSIIKQIEG